MSNDLISREALKKELNSRVFQGDYTTTLLLSSFNDLIDNAPTVEPNWRFYYDHGYAQAKRDLKKEIENLVVGGAEGLKNYYENGSKSDENAWIGGIYDAWELINNAQSQGEFVDISKLRLMTVEECAGHTIDYAMGWKACIEWIKNGGDMKENRRNETDN